MTAKLLIAATAFVTAGLATSQASLALTIDEPTGDDVAARTSEGARNLDPVRPQQPELVLDYAHLSEQALARRIDDANTPLMDATPDRLASRSPPAAGRTIYRF